MWMMMMWMWMMMRCCVQGHHSVGLMWWMLAREVLRMRGTISREHPWEVMPDLYFYRDPEEVRHARTHSYRDYTGSPPGCTGS